MAFLAQSEKEKEEQQQGGGPAPVNQESTSQGKTLSAPGAMSSSGSGTKQQGNAKGTGSGSFTNLNNYITANEGNDTAMGKKIRSNVDQQANEAQTLGSTFQNTAKDVTEQATVKLDEGALSDFNTDAVAFTGGTRNVAGQDVSNKDVFSGQINATYGGPNAANEIAGYQDTRDAYGNVDKSVQMATEGGIEGRSGLLQNAYNRPDYTRGQQTLDSFILGAGTGGIQEIQSIGDAYSGFGQGFDAIQSGAEGMIDDARTTTANTSKTWHDAYGTQHGGVWDAVDRGSELANATNQRNEEARARLIESMGNVNDFAKLAGLDKNTTAWLAQQTEGMSPEATREFLRQFTSQGGNALAGNFISEGNQQKFGALQDLLGLIDANEGYRDGPADFSKSSNTSAYDFNDRLGVAKDVASIDAAMKQAEQAYAQQMQQAQQSFGSLESTGFVNPTEMALLEAGYSRAEALALMNAMEQKGQTLSDYATFHDPGKAAYLDMLGVDSQMYGNLLSVLGMNPGDFGNAKTGYTLNTKGLNKLFPEPSGGSWEDRLNPAGTLNIQTDAFDSSALSRYNPAYIQQLLDQAVNPVQVAQPGTTTVDEDNPLAGLFI